MQPLSKLETLDRHALVMAIWLSLGFIAVALLHYGAGAGGPLSILFGFGAMLIAFVGHILVNAVYRTTFTRGELALGLVLYGGALIVFALNALLARTMPIDRFAAIGAGFLIFAATVIFYMLAHFGVRRTFEAFDVVRDFRSKGSDSVTERASDGDAR